MISCGDLVILDCNKPSMDKVQRGHHGLVLEKYDSIFDDSDAICTIEWCGIRKRTYELSSNLKRVNL